MLTTDQIRSLRDRMYGHSTDGDMATCVVTARELQELLDCYERVSVSPEDETRIRERTAAGRFVSPTDVAIILRALDEARDAIVLAASPAESVILCARELRANEREACAKVADAYRQEDNTILISAAEHIATRIRARGA